MEIEKRQNRLINNSLLYHILYKLWIWSKKYPIILSYYLGIDQRYTLTKLSSSYALVKKLIFIIYK
jgi:hypothetical protein